MLALLSAPAGWGWQGLVSAGPACRLPANKRALLLQVIIPRNFSLPPRPSGTSSYGLLSTSPQIALQFSTFKKREKETCMPQERRPELPVRTLEG